MNDDTVTVDEQEDDVSLGVVYLTPEEIIEQVLSRSPQDTQTGPIIDAVYTTLAYIDNVGWDVVR